MIEQSKQKIKFAQKVLAIATLSHIMQHLFVGASVIYPIIIEELNLSYTELGMVLGIAALFNCVFQFIYSSISRKIARHILLGFGNMLLALGMIVTGQAQNVFYFFSGQIISRVGTAAQHTMGTPIIAEQFDKDNVGNAIGKFYGIGYIGNVIGPLIITFLMVGIGWRNSLIILAIPTFLVGLVVMYFLRKLNNSKEEVIVKIKTSLKSDVLSIFKVKGILPLLIVQVFLAGGIEGNIIMTFNPLFLAHTLKVDTFWLGIIQAIALVGGVLGPVFLGKYGDKIGQLKVASLLTFLSIILIYFLSFHNAVTYLFIVHLFLLGFVSFSIGTLILSHLVKITQNHLRELLVAIFFTTGIGAGALWKTLIGYILDVYNSFIPAFIFMAILGCIGLPILLLQIKKDQTRKVQSLK